MSRRGLTRLQKTMRRWGLFWSADNLFRCGTAGYMLVNAVPHNLKAFLCRSRH